MDIDQKRWQILCSAQQIQQRNAEMGQQITQDYQFCRLYVVSLLRGSFIFTADLVRHIDLKLRIDFMISSSYGDRLESSGRVELVKDLDETDLSGMDVLLIDDIIDSGLTMEVVMEHLRGKNPNSLKSCVMLDKPSRRENNLSPDYVGFVIPDQFVVGYGLNYGDYYRNIPYVFAVQEEADNQE